MLLSAQIVNKTIGSKQLFAGLDITVREDEKVAIIGRNGAGKTSLFRILAREDADFEGEVQTRKNTSIIMTAQEHLDAQVTNCLDYILASLPDYTRLHHIIETYPETMGNNMRKIAEYSEALDRFNDLGYYFIEEKVLQALASYQLGETKARGPLVNLSGGQKRFVELVKVQQANARVALIDEPTNHMDYAAKASFIDWLRETDSTVVVITHDRDVLNEVDRIIEIKDKKAISFTGNYTAYLQQNSTNTVTSMAQYEIAQATIENVKKQILYARSKKASWGGTADKKNPFVVMEDRLKKQLVELQAITKPSFWIDQESAKQLNAKVVARYEKYKDNNIKLRGLKTDKQQGVELVSAEKLSLGYEQTGALFEDVSCILQPGGRVRLHGRNGAGKTTLVTYIRNQINNTPGKVTKFHGGLKTSAKIRLGVYEQEIDPRYLDYTLAEAITHMYREKELNITDQLVRQLLANYLFDPSADHDAVVRHLSGGQKARFQIMSMLATEPNMLILDEPTNHLDLPSIEELEKALLNYSGAIIYVSHDSYFVEKLGGETVNVGVQN
ncbi:MAG TPA: ABC-F family ATP-binding cassette domain-containing protein [Candidatus Saccharimonadales bacterium]|nr:ABC-F family ATP-binding cassette domain-containing protein [Candidatus Saccharimonadales bacterium]